VNVITHLGRILTFSVDGYGTWTNLLIWSPPVHGKVLLD